MQHITFKSIKLNANCTPITGKIETLLDNFKGDPTQSKSTQYYQSPSTTIKDHQQQSKSIKHNHLNTYEYPTITDKVHKTIKVLRLSDLYPLTLTFCTSTPDLWPMASNHTKNIMMFIKSQIYGTNVPDLKTLAFHCSHGRSLC